MCQLKWRGSVDVIELENILSKYKINKPKYKHDSLEKKSLPTMIKIFTCLIKNGIPPTQEEFINEFKKRHPDLKVRGIVSRLKKGYLSFVREYHLGFLLRNNFNNVLYDEELDIAGVDYLITYKNVEFNIHAFVDTENSRYWRAIKNKRHKFEGNHIDLPIDLSAGKRVGKFVLYTNYDVITLKKKMNDLIQFKKDGVVLNQAG